MLERFVTIPSSASSAPRARINHLKPMYDGQGTLAVNDLRGGFYIISDGEVSLYVDFDDVFPGFIDSPGLGTGFTSFAFHPEFASNGIFYTSHSENPGTGQADFTNPVTNAPVALQGVITEWVADNPLAKVFAGTRREVMRVDIVGTIHGMQEIAFNPNAQSGDPDYGKLYICIGDGKSTIGGYHLNTHRLDSVLGTILRIDPAGTNSANGQYGIPEDNPWANDGDPDIFDEILAYGFRNPHRISWDTVGDGKMLSGDIGEKNIEEVNLIEPGRDYGWNLREGTFVINPDWENNPQNGERDEVFELPLDDDTFGFTYPVAQYDHDDGFAIVGGFVYRGSVAPALFGKYIFGDIKGGEVYFVEADTLAFGTQSEIQELELELDGQPTTILQIGGSSRGDLRFGFDEDNELYLLEKSRGMVFKVIGAIDESGGGGIEPVEGWQGLSSFDDANLDDWVVSLDAQDTVQVNGSATIVDDPFDSDLGKVLEVNPGVAGSGTHHVTAEFPLPAEAVIRDPFPENFLSTFYFKIGRPDVEGTPGVLDITWGLVSGSTRPNNGVFVYDNYSIVGRYDVDGVMDIYDDESYTSLMVDPLDSNTFYEVWYVIDHTANSFSQYIKGGSQYPEQTLIYSNANYRHQTLANLDHLVIITSAGNTTDVKGMDSAYFADFFVDVSGANLFSPFTGEDISAVGGKLVNISTRGVVGTGDDVLIGGFVIGKDGVQVLVQAVGPELANDGVVGVLADPVLEIVNPTTQQVVASNDNWEDDQGQAIIDLWGGSPPLATGSLSSAVILQVDQGSYTAKISGKNDTEGVALVEVYEIE